MAAAVAPAEETCVTRRRTVVLLVAVSALATALTASATVPQAAQRVRAAIPAAEFYKAEHGTYAGMTAAKLRAIDRAVRNVVVKRAGKSSYCVQSTLAGPVVHFDGPKGPVRRGPCGVRGAVVPQPAASPAPADATTAKSRLRAAVPAIEMYRYDNGGYAGLTLAKIQANDAGIEGIRVVWSTAAVYCIESGSGAFLHHLRGPAGSAIAGRCPAAP
jgi:hypothetical protein